MHFNHWIKILLLSSAAVSPAFAKPKQVPYKVADSRTFVKLENAFKIALRKDDLSLLSDFYRTTLKAKDDQSISVLRSKDELGWGVVSIDHAANSPLLLQVPHRYFDKYTADIAKHWLKTGRFKMAIVNSVHRHAGLLQQPKVNSDQSTAPNSPFIAATRAFVTSYKQPKILQLHGFSQSKRRTFEGQRADIVLSHGANMPLPYLNQLTSAAKCIKSVMGYNALVFPKGVIELGGTKNVIGKEMRKFGHFHHFFHIELSQDVRIALRKDEQAAQQLLHCIVGDEQ
jgi:hypothetical protein